MGAAREGAVVWHGGDLVKEVDLDKPSSRVPSKLLDGGAESSTCGICSIVVQTRGLLDCCNHLFCFSCITEWFTVSNLCPLCKSRSRFITPQMLCGGTGQWEKLESGSGSLSRHEGPSDEDGQPVSFPPYFIDEEAVMCLEGDGCLVRAGLLDLDAEGNAASDTSVACDLCDCWYHGGCVSFQPDQTSFICPRCRTPKQTDKAYLDAQNMSTVASTEEKPSSTVTSAPPKNQSTYGVQGMFGSASIAIEDPEEGESHVSISLRRIPDVQPVKAQASVETQPCVEDSERELMWSPIREPFVLPAYGSAWRPVVEPSRGPKPTLTMEFLSSTSEPIRKVPYFEEELWSPTRGPAAEVPQLEELLSSTQDTVKDLSCAGTQSKFTTASANSFRATKPQKPTFDPHAAVPPRPEILNRYVKMESISANALKTETPDQDSRGLVQVSTPESVVHPMGLIKEEISIDVDRLQVAVEQLRKGKRKVLQEDERNIDVKDLPEMPRKIARKSTRKIDALDDKASDASNELVKKATTDKVTEKQTADKIVNSLESMTRMEAPDEKSLVAIEDDRRMATDVVVAEEQISAPQPKPLDDSGVKTEPTDGSSKEQYANPQSEVLSAPDKVDVANVEVGSEADVMDIVRDKRGSMVRDTNDASCTSKGVRTRIIMHREPDMNDSERPSLVERIRQEMRDTAGYGAGDDLGKVEVSDDRFIAAFKAAQTRSYEKAKEVKSLSTRQQGSGRLWKVLDKKYSANGTRDNLIRKLYAGGGRKCWDRDWDIAFWRERDPHQRRARKEAEGEVDGSGKDSGVTGVQPDSEDADFFNRLYVADTSLFPRNEDVKPLLVAERGGMSEPERSRTRKVLQPHIDKVSATLGAKDNAQQSPVVQGASGNTSSADKLLRGSKTVELVPSKTLKKPLRPSSVFIEASLTANASASSGKSQGAPSTAPRAQGKDKEATSASSDLKKDKRQWALEVLARKEGKLISPASAGKTGGGGSATKDNPFHLLLQLPVEIRPLILGDSRRNKIPSAVRQVQLNRLVEQELKKANLAVVLKSSVCVDAIARAVAREEELCKSSNSKGVYLNRCARALANTEYEVKVVETSPPKDRGGCEVTLEESLRPEYDEAVRKALEDTGLMDSPTGDAANEHDGHNGEDSLDIVCKVSDTNRESRPTRPVENKWVENVLEVENADLDIYGDFDFHSEDELDGALAKMNSRRLKYISAASCNSSDGKARAGSLVVVLPSTCCPSDAVLESVEPEGPTKKLLSKQSAEEHGGASSSNRDGGVDASTSPCVEAQAYDPHGVPSFDDAEDMYDGLELNLNPVMSSEVMAQLRAEPCAPLSPKLEPRRNQEGLRTLSLEDVDIKKRKEGESLPKGDPAASENITEDDCLKFADIDRRIENIRRSKALNGDPLRSKKSKGRVHGDANRTNGTNVQMQVEIYVNQHLKPLYRSQVITAEQFKWTVSKTAAKVMEHHGNAVSADFLITEGSKVKKLADQYLQAFTHRKA